MGELGSPIFSLLNYFEQKMNDEMKERLERSFRPLSLKMTYILLGSRKIPANYVLFDEGKMEVIKPVSNKFNLINNSELVGRLGAIGRYKILSVNCNKSNDTYYYAGYFPELSITDTKGDTLFIGFEVGNSFSGRFLPYANYSLYHYRLQMFIRTTLPIFTYKRSDFQDCDTNKESLATLMNFFKSGMANRPYEPDMKLIKDMIPEKLYHYEDMYPVLAEQYGSTFYAGLFWTSLLAKKWSDSAYELAVFTTYKMWDMLVGIPIKKVPPHLTEEELTKQNQEELFNEVHE